MRVVNGVAYAEWLADWSAAWGVPELPDRVRIEFSERLQRSLGRCSPRAGVIRLNPGLQDADPEALREVVCHEAAHVATWLLHGRRARAHGPEWKDFMRRAGYEARVRWTEASVPASVRGREGSTVIYVHTCPICRLHWIAKRVVATWRCGTCRAAGLAGRLTVSRCATMSPDPT